MKGGPHEVRGGPRAAFTLATRLALLGGGVALGSTLFVSAFSGPMGLFGGMAFGLWALVPYLLLLVFGRVVSSPWAVGGAGLAALAAECGIRAAVFLFPRGSTAALALIFSPAWIAALALPVGALAGFLLGRLWRTGHVAGRGLAATLGALALVLVVLGLARPELLPTAVLKRRQVLERLGPPRVVTGGERFDGVFVSDRSAWHLAADLDGQPGDEIAIVDHEGADILDGSSLAHLSRVELGGNGRLWNWYSTLARVEGSLVVVQTGGGYSETELRRLDGTLLWSYRPNPALSPSALRPADLDGDGATELYASWDRALVRLDGRGREVWSRPTRMAALVGLAPRSSEAPAWVVGHEYARRLAFWDETGRPLAEIPVTQADTPLGVVDYPRGRGLALGGRALRVVGLDGRPTFERPMEDDLTPVQALSFRPDATGTKLLAVAATAPRDVRRARLFIFDAAGAVCYDEVLATPPRLMRALRADGAETLLLSANGLRALRPAIRPARERRP